ncbi:hypothetical protein OXPF_25560 [Oxobacter pfennigii]|uniref:DUF4179 domain-containing protein n=1 Tax=Oxobacter pfennigii TaxID=36849 RepID=A0A0P8W5E0_9CLOT|nr:DUF4179 domain-containing protein [Oxobacter pfennigii]KPU43851.1 hypothetical protein OXPF_25560 [Oxobacter pfennigii]
MRDIEAEFKIKKAEIDNIDVPEELYDRLRNALDNSEDSPSKTGRIIAWFIKHKALAAVFLLMAFFVVYNYDVFAYYGRKVLGYDEIIYGTIKELNEMGMGQEINKSYRFKNGSEVTVDGAMLDENKLVVMYTLRGETEEGIEGLSLQPLKGIFGSYDMSVGRGIISDDKKEIKWIHEFERPNLFDKNLTFSMVSLTDDISKNEVGNIDIRLDMSKAIKSIVKGDINKTIEFEGIKYKFETMSATPMSVVIEGSISSGIKNVTDFFSGEEALKPVRNMELELTAEYMEDGSIVTENLQRGVIGISRKMDGAKFRCEFNGALKDIRILTLNFVKVRDVGVIDRTIDIDGQTRNINVIPGSEELTVKEVKTEEGSTAVTFIIPKDVNFVFALMVDGSQAKTLFESSNEIEGDSGLIERTFTFEGSSKDMQLMFKTFNHEKYVNQNIILYQSN